MRLRAGYYIPQFQQSTACMSLVDYPSLLGNIDWGCRCRYLNMPEGLVFPSSVSISLSSTTNFTMDATSPHPVDN